MVPYLKLVRPINLLVIITTQVLLYVLIIYPPISNAGLIDMLSYSLFSQLVCCTVLLAATAYIINDIYDIDIDKINKPSKLIVSNQISVQAAYYYYIILTFIGFLLAINIAYYTNRLNLLWIYPISVIGLFLYAKRWKTTLFIGNIIVALFSAFVAAILWISELKNLEQLRLINDNEYQNVIHIFCFYILFAFLTSLFREIIKDMQDIEGDQYVQARTIVLVYGQKKTKVIAHILSILTILCLCIWILDKYDIYSKWTSLVLLLGVIIPIIHMQLKLIKAKTSADYKYISQYTKLVMLIGITYLFLL